jgi:hypothetical protein
MEMDRVLGIDGVQLIGINNRNLGMLFFFKLLILNSPSDTRQAFCLFYHLEAC